MSQCPECGNDRCGFNYSGDADHISLRIEIPRQSVILGSKWLLRPVRPPEPEEKL